MLVTIIVFILTLSLLVLIHEFGHFYVARKFGIRVLEFGLGIPPRAWSTVRNGMIISLNWLPIGGFVRLQGEDEVDEKALKTKDSFAVKPVYQRILVVVAGVIMNLLFAWILFTIVLVAQGFKEEIPLIRPYHFWGVTQQNDTQIIIGGVAKDSPAEKAGLQKQQKIVQLDHQPLKGGDELIAQTKQKLGQEMTLTVTDIEGNNSHEVMITPRQNPPAGQGALGVELVNFSVAHLSYPTTIQKIFSGAIHGVNLIGYSFTILGSLISSSFENKTLGPVSQTLSGPVGITNISNTILQSKAPLLPYLEFIGALSLNLAVFNILPFPALDGGRVFFLLIEAVFRKKVAAEIEKMVHTVGMALLLLLMVLITFSDLRKIFF